MKSKILGLDHCINKFFDRETVYEEGDVVFSFGRKTYPAISKILIITRSR